MRMFDTSLNISDCDSYSLVSRGTLSRAFLNAAWICALLLPLRRGIASFERVSGAFLLLALYEASRSRTPFAVDVGFFFRKSARTLRPFARFLLRIAFNCVPVRTAFFFPLRGSRLFRCSFLSLRSLSCGILLRLRLLSC